MVFPRSVLVGAHSSPPQVDCGFEAFIDVMQMVAEGRLADSGRWAAE